MIEEQTQTKEWVKDLVSNAVNTAKNDQNVWFHHKLGEVKNIFNVEGIVGPAQNDPYPNHKAFITDIYTHKLASEKFQVDSLNPI